MPKWLLLGGTTDNPQRMYSVFNLFPDLLTRSLEDHWVCNEACFNLLSVRAGDLALQGWWRGPHAYETGSSDVDNALLISTDDHATAPCTGLRVPFLWKELKRTHDYTNTN